MTQRLPKSSRRSRSLSQQRLLGYRLRQQRLKRRRMLMEQLEVRHLLAADSLLELPANSRQADVQPLQNDAQPLQNETQTLQNDALPLRASQLIEQASLTESIAIQAALAPTSTIVFVDTGIEGYQSIVEKLTPTDPEDMRLVVLLEADQDGIQQIGNVLRGLKGIDAVHILSHGTSGSLQLGRTQLNAENLDRYQTAMEGWSDALTTEADLLLYGCNVADGQTGVEFIERLSRITGADIAASSDLTGSGALGGDLELEVTTGYLQTEPLIAMGSYSGLLYTFDRSTVEAVLADLQAGGNEINLTARTPVVTDVDLTELNGKLKIEIDKVNGQQVSVKVVNEDNKSATYLLKNTHAAVGKLIVGKNSQQVEIEVKRNSKVSEIDVSGLKNAHISMGKNTL